MSITYTKLRDESWGVRSTTEIHSGQTITVTKKSGETKVETVRAVVFAKDGVWIASIESKPMPKSNRTTPSVGGKRPRSGGGCSRCCRTATRTAQVWEDCDFCGNEPIYV